MQVTVHVEFEYDDENILDANDQAAEALADQFY